MITPSLNKIYVKNVALVRFLFSLLVNGFTFFAISVWKWNFFTIIYLYWAEEVIRIFFWLIQNRINYNQNQISKSECRENNKGTLVLFFFMALYFVFIVLIVGIIIPSTDEMGENLLTVLFLNREFNLNLLLAISSEIAILIYIFLKYNKNKSEKQSKEETKTIKQKLEKEFLIKQEEEKIKKQNYQNRGTYQSEVIQDKEIGFPTQMLVLHVSIIFGTLFYFAANTNKLPIQIDLGKAGEFAFVLVFAAIQTIAEVYDFVKSRKK